MTLPSLPSLLPFACLSLLSAALLSSCASTPIEGLQTFTYKAGDHRDGRLIYAENPPVGGPHSGVWQNCGVYDRPIYDERAVHSLEHGAVWITYHPTLTAGQRQMLKDLIAGRPYTLMSPYPGLSAPVIISAWGAQLKVQDAGDTRIKAFLDRYEQGPTAPERGASCSGASSETQ